MTTNKRTDQVLAALRGPAPTIGAPTPSQERSTGPRDGFVRFTFDMDRTQHRFVKRFALESETSLSAATRALWTLVEEDPGLAERLKGLLANQQRSVS